MLSEEFIQQMKERLEQEKKETKEKIAKYTSKEDSMDNPDLDDLSNDATEDILEESLEANYRNMLRKINHALKKIEEETYGMCDECEAEISEEELNLAPWAAECMACRKMKM